MEKVRAAVLNLFPTISITVESLGERVYLVGRGEDIEALNELRGLISRERIADSARRALRSSMVAGGLKFYLNKQVATIRHISFCEPEGESPLGPITVTIESDRPDEIIDWLAPKTSSSQSGRGTSRVMKSSAMMVSGKMRRARSRKPSSSG